MLFFFELGLFLLIMVTLALGEFVSRGAALTTWLVATVGSLVGYLLARRPLVRLAELSPPASSASGGLPPGSIAAPSPPPDRSTESTTPPPPDPFTQSPTPSPTDPAAALDRRWARTLLHYWGRTNLLLLLGAALVGGWYLLAAGAR